MAFITEHLSETGRKSASSHAFLLLKNLLFWGSMALTGYLLYFMASLTVG
ncbi:hypothetical protein [Roseibium sp.]